MKYSRHFTQSRSRFGSSQAVSQAVSETEKRTQEYDEEAKEVRNTQFQIDAYKKMTLLYKRRV